MNSFSEIIPHVINSLGLQRKFSGEIVILHWRDIVGDRIAEHTRPTKIYQGILTVITNNTVWAHHLMTSKEDIIDNINKFCHEKVINEIKFKAGYLKNDQNEENIEEDFFVPDWRKAILTSEENVKINDTVRGLSDDVLRQKLRHIIAKDLAQKKAKDDATWRSCEHCGILCPPQDTVCPACLVEAKEKRIRDLRELLLQAPWMDYNETVKYIDCHQLEYNTSRDELIDRLSRKITQGKTDELTVTSLAMLIHHKKPRDLTTEIINNILDKVRGK